MSLAPGTRLGPYEITAPLAAGGMGEVYKARDTRIPRDVAIKTSTERFSDRFQLEARAIGALNHPNICTLFDVGPDYLVMELVEGSAPAGPMPEDEVLRVAEQIAAALAFAHEKGIVHRDLKAANVKLTAKGTLKVLDFGLAKVARDGSSDASTLTVHATQAGMILGTPAYMAPEQAQGKEIDRRADVWAFGVLLYELITGDRPFRGGSTPETLAAVLTQEPDWRRVPRRFQRLLRASLAKDSRQRLSSIGDWRLLLDEPGDGSTDSLAVTSSTRKWGWLVAAGIAGLGVAAAAIGYFPRQADAPEVSFSTILPPANLTISNSTHFALSLDGRRLAIVARTADGRSGLWIRELASPTARLLAGTEDAVAPFWSPDSRFVAFVAGGRLKRVDAAGGAVFMIAEPALGTPGAWNRDDVILFTPGRDSPLSRVNAGGGNVAAATMLDASAGESTHTNPFFLPDGGRFLYSTQSSTTDPLEVRIGSLDSMQSKPLLKGALNAQYAQNVLLFAQESALLARPFDATSLTFIGPPVPITNQISTGLVAIAGLWGRMGAFSVSDTGVLVYQSAAPGPSRLVWLDRAGREIGSLGDSGLYGDLTLSRDGSKVSVSIDVDGNRDIWIFDTRQGLGARATFDPGDETDGILSPDGSRIIYNKNPTGRHDLFEKEASASGEEVSVLADQFTKIPLSWSPNGEFILFLTSPGPTSSAASVDLWSLSRSGDRVPRPFLPTPYDEGFAATFSPDGRWVAYTSRETGRNEVYVAPFPPDAPRKRRISAAGGETPKWGQQGRELFYYEPDSGQLIVVPLEYHGTDVSPGAARPLFKVRPIPFWALWYDVTSDGQRFLVNTPSAPYTVTPITLVLGWTSLLKSSTTRQ